MRRSSGGCYEITGIRVRRVMDGPGENVALARWRERQADLWAESGTIAHVHRHMTAEESGLWHAMWEELQAVNAAIARLEGAAAGRS
jgi:hypothetical protein